MENASAEYLKGAFFWHIDGTLQKTPILASFLSCWRLSPIGGQTEFADTYAAYDDLPESEKKSASKVCRSSIRQEAAQRYVNPEPAYAELAGL